MHDFVLRYGREMGFNTSIMTLIFHVLFLVLLLVALAFLLYMLHRGRVERRKMRRLIDRLRLSNSKLSRYVDLDDLTAAQSRRYLVDRIDRHKRRETHALLYVDLDDFKTVNDTYGHDVGDALLIEVTDAMGRHVGPEILSRGSVGMSFASFLKVVTWNGVGRWRTTFCKRWWRPMWRSRGAG